MQIDFIEALPIPLAENLPGDSLWKQKLTFSSPGMHLIKAPSGRGKSTLLHMLFGIRKDYSGNILINGENIRKFSIRQWADLRRSSLAMMFQDLNLFPRLTVLDNIMIKQRISGGLHENKIREMCERMDIQEKMNTPCGILSLGQQQRVALLRALVQPFDFLLLDEPFSHLDAQNAAVAFDIIKEECQQRQAGSLITSLGNEHNYHYDQVLNI